MRTVTPPHAGAPMQRSVAACLASVLELHPDDFPCPTSATPSPGRSGHSGSRSVGWGSSR
jgi:hypothetical protein